MTEDDEGNLCGIRDEGESYVSFNHNGGGSSAAFKIAGKKAPASPAWAFFAAAGERERSKLAILPS
jgi:UDP-N-acetylmuramyl tripeptide synthase